MSSAAKKAWATMRAKGIKPKRKKPPFTKSMNRRLNAPSAARKARATMKKGRRIKIHSPRVKVNGSAKTTYAAPKKWWDHMTKDPHGPSGRPLSAPAAGHLWFKVYGNAKRLAIIKEYG